MNKYIAPMSVCGRASLLFLLTIRNHTAICPNTSVLSTVPILVLRSSSFKMSLFCLTSCLCNLSSINLHRRSSASILCICHCVSVRSSMSLICLLDISLPICPHLTVIVRSHPVFHHRPSTLVRPL